MSVNDRIYRVIPPKWNGQLIVDKHGKHLREFARIKTPHGMKTKMRENLGRLEHRCFPRCLQVAWFYPDKFWYCEGVAAGHPHAWLCPKTIHGDTSDEDWAIDPIWIWKSKKFNNGQPLDSSTYIGFKFDARKAIPWLKANKGSVSLLRHADLWDYEELI